jgi:hypothetical protein
MKKFFKRAGRILLVTLSVAAGILLMTASILPAGDRTERIRYYTRNLEFGFEGWMLNALRMKVFEGALGATGYLSDEVRHRLVSDYLMTISHIYRKENEINQVYTDPSVTDANAASAPLRVELEQLQSHRDLLAPQAEEILQSQIGYVAEQMGLTMGGQPMPPVLYRSIPLPFVLIVSPRDAIRADENIALQPGMPIEDRVALEEKIDHAVDMSSLVVPIGGLGAYPTMVLETDNLDSLSEIVAHEWTHNFLSLRPLGASYMESPELRTMNETSASIAGKEIGRVVLEQFYPELVPPAPQLSSQPSTQLPKPVEPPAFN